jgi:regulator of sigma E protease
MIYLIIILILGLAILIHELGHLIMAKWVQMPIQKFSIGFGRKLWGVKKGDTEYQLSLIPLGGYVLPRIESEEDYWRFPLWRFIFFTLGGVAANVLAAFVCLGVINVWASGFSFSSLVTAPAVQLADMTTKIVSFIPQLFKKPDEISGIVGIVAFGGEYVGLNIIHILKFSYILNLNLAILNLLPLPPLDGGKIILSLLQKFYQPFQRLQIPLAIAGWLFIIGLIIYVTINDIKKWILAG